jgi:hypothetical protein
MSALIPFPPRRRAAVFVVRERGEKGWLVLCREFGWAFGDRRQAEAEARRLGRQHGLRVLEESR